MWNSYAQYSDWVNLSGVSLSVQLYARLAGDASGGEPVGAPKTMDFSDKFVADRVDATFAGLPRANSNGGPYEYQVRLSGSTLPSCNGA